MPKITYNIPISGFCIASMYLYIIQLSQDVITERRFFIMQHNDNKLLITAISAMQDQINAIGARITELESKPRRRKATVEWPTTIVDKEKAKRRDERRLLKLEQEQKAIIQHAFDNPELPESKQYFEGLREMAKFDRTPRFSGYIDAQPLCENSSATLTT
jgi:hypothetical protein